MLPAGMRYACTKTLRTRKGQDQRQHVHDERIEAADDPRSCGRRRVPEHPGAAPRAHRPQEVEQRRRQQSDQDERDRRARMNGGTTATHRRPRPPSARRRGVHLDRADRCRRAPARSRGTTKPRQARDVGARTISAAAQRAVRRSCDHHASTRVRHPNRPVSACVRAQGRARRRRPRTPRSPAAPAASTRSLLRG